MSTDEDAGKAWTAALHERIRSTLREARDAARMSAQEVADETARLGYPMSRSGVARYEAGTKLGLDVSELLVLAAALRIPPVTLVFSGHPDGPVEVLPGDTRATTTAIGWFCGDMTLSKDAVANPNSPSATLLRLTRERAEMVSALADLDRRLASNSEWARRSRETNLRGIQKITDDIAEINSQIEDLTEKAGE
ncbi:helix-turn-helix domain-containing protein [Mycolicibacterium sp. Dal123E01]|uniref:helix-turn-helix domain-containing protein n=1 Tax=Mycolicibacterium sp. Dal123E01 TaxID=3457578 RepID=UPI00403E7F75